MKKQLSLTIFLFCLMAVQGFSADIILRPGPEYDARRKDLQAKHCVWTTVNNQPIPVGGVVVDFAATWDPGTGFHGHEQLTNKRPAVFWPNGSVGTTDDLTGCTKVSYIPAGQNDLGGFSGFLSVTGTPRNPIFAPDGERSYFAVRDHGWDSRPVPFSRLVDDGFLTAEHDYDSRHGISNVSYNRYGTKTSVRMIEQVAAKFSGAEINVAGWRLDLIRGAMPDGNKADNQQAIRSGSAMLYPEWAAQSAEGHHDGNEWDVENPTIFNTGGNELYAKLIFQGFQTFVVESGCHFGITDQNGVPLGGTSSIYLTRNGNGFWYSQPIVHVVCAIQGPRSN